MTSDITPLLTYVNGKYVLDESTLEWISQRSDPFSVLACAGKFRTGKSFLLNRMLSKWPGKGFGVGETVQACTRGIWLSRQFLPGQDGGTDVLVMDTEGIDALDAENENDVRVFALAVLLSSAFVYNSMSHLDEAALQTLSIMTRIADTFANEGGPQHHPTLYWVLRDFALQLKDEEGNTITGTEYLERALDGAPASKCATREALKTVFPTRHLVTMPRPHRGESAQKLDARGSSALNPSFEKSISEFRSRVCMHSSPMMCGAGGGGECGRRDADERVPMTGAMYAAYIRHVVEKVNSDGAIPKLQDSWTLLSKVQHSEAEAAMRGRLLDAAEKECPIAPREKVDVWAGTACQSEISSAKFAAPRPSPGHVEEMRDRLESDLIRHCVALGKVQDVAAIAKGAVQDACDLIASSSYADISPLNPSLLADAEVRHVFTEMALDALCSHVWKDAVRVIGDRARVDAESVVHLKTMQLEADSQSLRLQVDEAAEREEALRCALELARTLPAREDASTCTDVVQCAPVAREWDGSVDTALDTNRINGINGINDEAESLKLIMDLNAKLEDALRRLSNAEDANLEAATREENLSRAYETGIETLRSETVSQIEALRGARDSAVAEARACEERRLTLETEGEKLRSLAREAQERAVETHKTTLQDLRRRDSDAKDTADSQRREHCELHAKWQSASIEERGLKRRVDELLVHEDEVKRLRVVERKAEIDRARGEAEKESIVSQLEQSRAENEKTRLSNIALEREVAVLKATGKLETARRAMFEAE